MVLIARQHPMRAKCDICMAFLSVRLSIVGNLSKVRTLVYFDDLVGHHSSFWAPPSIQNFKRNPHGVLNTQGANIALYE